MADDRIGRETIKHAFSWRRNVAYRRGNGHKHDNVHRLAASRAALIRITKSGVQQKSMLFLGGAMSEEVSLSDVPCMKCKQSGGLEVTWRMEVVPEGTYSLAGAQPKVAMRQWPWMVCRNCGEECRGKLSTE